MKFCTKCGKEMLDEAVVCPNCGCATGSGNVTRPAEADAPSIGFAFLGFFIPLVGLILYLVFKNTSPLKAKSAGKGALIGFVVGIVVTIVYAILLATVLSSLTSSYYWYY